MKPYLSLFLICALLLGLMAGCGSSSEAYVPTGDGLTLDEDQTGTVKEPEEEETVQELTLVYDPDTTMNPYRCVDYTNRALFSLIYQGLFCVDQDYNVQPMLCDRYSISEDMRTYTFYIDKNATFSDGTRLTDDDVLASLATAKAQPYYANRFTNVILMDKAEGGGITITLSSAYENLPLLLDIPIVKAAEVDEDLPLGTGPYVLQDLGLGMQLTRRTNWWCSANMTVTAPIIALYKGESLTQIRDEFQFGQLDLVQADPGSDVYADYRCDYELWDSENGIFLYLATSTDSEVFKVDALRIALTYAVDRDLLVAEYYRGFAQSACLPASPSSPYYSQVLAQKYSYDGEKFAQAVKSTGSEGKEIVFLVNKDDSLRLRVARRIGEMLKAGGLKVTMKELGGNAYVDAVKARQYDIYLGQTKLSPNMDLTPFFRLYGSLSFGIINDSSIYAMCQQALANSGNYYNLHETIAEDGRIVPVLFQVHSVHATRGLLTTMAPARDNVFHYTVGKVMADVLP